MKLVSLLVNNVPNDCPVKSGGVHQLSMSVQQMAQEKSLEWSLNVHNWEIKCERVQA